MKKRRSQNVKEKLFFIKKKKIVFDQKEKFVSIREEKNSTFINRIKIMQENNALNESHSL